MIPGPQVVGTAQTLGVGHEERDTAELVLYPVHASPEHRWGYDTEIVSNLIAVFVPVLWHGVAEKCQQRSNELPESGVALVVGEMPVHQPP
jgi:hypothetical protein